MTTSAEVQAAISRYLVEVATYLGGRSPDQRRELLADLESHIHEALARRGHEPTHADLEAVLAEMAPPGSYAAAGPGEQAAGGGGASRWLPRTLGGWALTLAIGGIVVPVVLEVILATLQPDGRSKGIGILFPVLELVALVLAIVARRERLGKVAIVVAAILMLAGVALMP